MNGALPALCVARVVHLGPYGAIGEAYAALATLDRGPRVPDVGPRPGAVPRGSGRRCPRQSVPHRDRDAAGPGGCRSTGVTSAGLVVTHFELPRRARPRSFARTGRSRPSPGSRLRAPWRRQRGGGRRAFRWRRSAGFPASRHRRRPDAAAHGSPARPSEHRVAPPVSRASIGCDLHRSSSDPRPAPAPGSRTSRSAPPFGPDIWCEPPETPTLRLNVVGYAEEVSMNASEAFEGIRVFGEHEHRELTRGISHIHEAADIVGAASHVDVRQATRDVLAWAATTLEPHLAWEESWLYPAGRAGHGNAMVDACGALRPPPARSAGRPPAAARGDRRPLVDDDDDGGAALRPDRARGPHSSPHRARGEPAVPRA